MKQQTGGRTLLIDADILVYRSAHRALEKIHWQDNDVWTYHAKLEPAIVKLEEFIHDLRDNLLADDVTIVLSDLEKNFRKDFCDEYKQNRSGIERPLLFHPLREHLQENWGAEVWDGIEADDTLGILCTEETSEERILCSIDKDMGTVPGLHFNWDSRSPFPFHVNDDEANYNHMTQTLTGDATDGYTGIKGVGPKTAAKPLKGHDDPTSRWNAVVAAYKDAGLGREVALMYARCAYILRDGDYNHDTGEVTLWVPQD